MFLIMGLMIRLNYMYIPPFKTKQTLTLLTLPSTIALARTPGTRAPS